jgi:hypothetical protein
MCFKLFAIVALLSLMAEQQASAQQIAATGDGSVAAFGAADTANLARTSPDGGPEQVGDLYRSQARTGGDIGPSARQDEPMPGALNPSIDPLGADRAASDPK